MPHLFSRLRAALEASVNQRVTRLGFLYTLACVLVALAAFSSANNLLFLILAAMLATLMISGLVSRLSLAGLAIDLIVPKHIPARRKVQGRLVLYNEKHWMASFSIQLSGHGKTPLTGPKYFPVIPGGAKIEQPVELLFDKRGIYKENTFRFSTRFPFGFAERRLQVQIRREVVIYPALDPQPGFEEFLAALTGEIESYRRGQGSDLYRIRPYQVLESARHVDWKATAHTGDLQVREFAREEDRSLTFFLDIDVPHEREAWFERSVEYCAFLIWHLAARDLQIRFLTQRWETLIPLEADVYAILRYLATVTPAVGKIPYPPDAKSDLLVVFSLRPDRLEQAGWDLSSGRTRVLGSELLGAVPDDAAKPTASH